MVIVVILCLTVIFVVLIISEYSCKHTWDVIKVEYTKSVMGWKRYKVITHKCINCNKVSVDKYKIN